MVGGEERGNEKPRQETEEFGGDFVFGRGGRRPRFLAGSFLRERNRGGLLFGRSACASPSASEHLGLRRRQKTWWRCSGEGWCSPFSRAEAKKFFDLPRTPSTCSRNSRTSHFFPERFPERRTVSFENTPSKILKIDLTTPLVPAREDHKNRTRITLVTKFVKN